MAADQQVLIPGAVDKVVIALVAGDAITAPTAEDSILTWPTADDIFPGAGAHDVVSGPRDDHVPLRCPDDHVVPAGADQRRPMAGARRRARDRGGTAIPVLEGVVVPAAERAPVRVTPDLEDVEPDEGPASSPEQPAAPSATTIVAARNALAVTRTVSPRSQMCDQRGTRPSRTKGLQAS